MIDTKIMKTKLTGILLLCILFLPGCVAQNTAESETGIKPGITSKTLEQESYRIQPGDRLEIKFFYNSDLDASVVVRPDGKIAVQLLGEVQAAGLTLTELDEQLTESYATELLRPEITINVSDFQGRVYVGGEVNRQGYIGFRNNMTPLQAVLNAGGFTKWADPNSTVVIRNDENNKPVNIVVDLDKVIEGKNNDSGFLLLPDDIVYVPKRF